MLVDGWGVVKGSAYLWVTCVTPSPSMGFEVAAGAKKVSILLAFVGGTQQTQYENLHCYYRKFASL